MPLKGNIRRQMVRNLESSPRILRLDLRRQCLSYRRCLHQSFWSHGAASINLPAWWILFLQHSSFVRPPNHRNLFEFDRAPTEGHIRARFVNLLLSVHRQSCIRGVRQYTKRHQNAAKGIKHSYRAFSAATRELLYLSGQKFVDPPKISRDVITQHHSSQRKAFDIAINNQPQHSSPIDISCDYLWQRYMQLVRKGERLSTIDIQKLFSRLHDSPSTSDAERIIKLFESIPVHERRAIHYYSAILGLLRLGNGADALALQRQANERFATSQSLGGSNILSFAIENQDWTLASTFWSSLGDIDLEQDLANDLWSSHSQKSPGYQFEKADSAADYALTLDKYDSPALISASRKFSAAMMRQAFTPSEGFASSKPGLQVWRELMKKVRKLHNADSEIGMLSLGILAIHQAITVGKEEWIKAALDEAREFYQALPQFSLTSDTLSEILDYVDPLKDTDLMSSIIQDWSTNIRFPRVYFNEWMNAFAQIGNVEAAQKCLDMGIASGTIQEAPVTGNLMLKVYLNTVQPDRAATMFENLRTEHGWTPDIFSYNTIIAAFARVGDYVEAMSWFSKMQNAGIEPDGYTYTSLAVLHATRGDSKMVEDIKAQAQKTGFGNLIGLLDASVLDKVSNEKFSDAEELARTVTMERKDKASLTHMWNILLTGRAMKNEIGHVVRLQHEMRRLEVPFNSLTFSSLILAHCVSAVPREGLLMIEDSMSIEDAQPSAIHFANIMKGFLRTGEYEEALKTHKTMMERGIAPTMSTSNILLRVGRSLNSSSESDNFKYMRQILSQIVENLDRSELISREPRKYVAPGRLDDAFIASYFEYVLALFGNDRAFDLVADTFQEYVQGARRFDQLDVHISPPAQILSSLLIAHSNANDDTAVERCWALARKKLDPLARKADHPIDPKAQEQPDWVLFSRRLIINPMLTHYLRHLAKTNNIGGTIKTVKELFQAGYDLDHKNYNLYVQALAQSFKTEDVIHGLEVCEEVLMPGCPQWQDQGHGRWSMKRFFRKLESQNRVPSGHKQPDWQTLHVLASACVRLQKELGQVDREVLRRLHTQNYLPNVLGMIRQMPHVERRFGAPFFRG